MDYNEFLKNPRWQKMRLEILERDNWTCRNCGNTEEMLMVHHTYYAKGKRPWEYPAESLITLCHYCHSDIHDSKGKRAEYESALIEILRRKFTTSQLSGLLGVFNETETRHPQWEIIAIIAIALKAGPLQDKFVDSFLQDAERRGVDLAFWEQWGEEHKHRTIMSAMIDHNQEKDE